MSGEGVHMRTDISLSPSTSRRSEVLDSSEDETPYLIDVTQKEAVLGPVLCKHISWGCIGEDELTDIGAHQQKSSRGSGWISCR